MRDGSFTEALEAIVQRYPDAPAIVDRGHVCSYRMLWRKAQRAGAFLKAQGIGKEDIVGLNMAKSEDYIVGLLGTWMAGAAFLPLDPSLPRERLDYIVAEAEPRHVITEIDSLPETVFNPAPLHPADLAYVIYTSGSTGRPKGVMVEHRGLMPMLQTQIEAFGLAPGKKSLFYLSIAFDASVSDIGASLLSGAALVIEDEKRLKDGADLMRLMQEQGITHFDCPPSLLRVIRPEHRPSSLETVIIGGEVCPPEVVRDWAKHVRVINVYGPTETTVCSSLCRCDESWQLPLIGAPVRGTRLQVFEGELYIGGDGVARGYLKQPALSAQKFIMIGGERFYKTGDAVRELEDGSIVFLGRIDRQFKLHGQLIEPGEIESRILQCAGVRQAAVIKRPLAANATGEALVAFVGGEASSAGIRASLEAVLPRWMVPYHIEHVAHLPVTVSGKPDYAFLKTAPLSFGRSDAPREKLTATQERLFSIWRKILGHGLFGLDDSFFQAGGDSLDVIRLTLEADRAGLPFAPGLLSSHPTIRLLAGTIDTQAEDDMSRADNLRKEAALDDELRALTSAPRMEAQEGDIFLTGVTGALGSRLLLELLDKTTAKIYCLVRAKDDAQAKVRLHEKIGFDDARIIALAGDAGEKLFGLAPERWEQLCRDVGAIYHCAATVNMVASYADLKAANVGGVKEALRLALTERKKHIHYASTLSVFVATDRNTGLAREDDELDKTHMVYGGYAQTKFVAELMLQQVPVEEATVTQYRFGLITGDSLTGAGAEADFLSLFVRGIEALGVIPPREKLQHLAVDITPIDFAAAAMADISLKKGNSGVYHIANAKSLSLPDFLDSLQRCGIALSETTQEEWERLPEKRPLTRVESSAWMALCRVLPPKDFAHLRTMDLFQSTDIVFDMQRSGFSCPPPDGVLIDKYVRHILSRARKIRRICLFGPESTGKSTLAQQLARHFNTVYVPEFAKGLIEARGGDITAADISLIATGQAQAEDAAASLCQAGEMLICDTDLLTTAIWSEWLFKSCPGWIRMEAAQRKYDLYLLMDIDVPWVDDIHRYAPEKRQEFMHICEHELKNMNARYIKISGSWQSRFSQAVAAIEALA